MPRLAQDTAARRQQRERRSARRRQLEQVGESSATYMPPKQHAPCRRRCRRESARRRQQQQRSATARASRALRSLRNRSTISSTQTRRRADQISGSSGMQVGGGGHCRSSCHPHSLLAAIWLARVLDGWLHHVDAAARATGRQQHADGEHAEHDRTRALEVLQLRDVLRWPTSPKITRLTSHSVYAAPRISVIAGRKRTRSCALNAARITRNSPTKPTCRAGRSSPSRTAP